MEEFQAMTPTRDQILAEVLKLLNSVVRDWEFEGPVGPNTRLFADLAFESLDLVVLGAKVQEHFGQNFPFPQLFAEIGQREVRDLTIGEWVDFIERHLAAPAATAAAAGARPEAR
jgi:acyl carrier protein